MPEAHPAGFFLPLFKRTRGQNEIKKLVVQDKDREIVYQLPSQAEQT